MTQDELYRTYYRWTGQLHKLVGTHLGRHVDVEYFPDDWVIKVYSGSGEDQLMTGWWGATGPTVPGIIRPADEARETIKLPRPEDNPTRADMDATFRALCVAVAHVLGITLAGLKLPASKLSMLLENPPE